MNLSQIPLIDIQPDNKTCKTCLQSKPRSEFYKNPTNRDKLQSSCARCYCKKQSDKARSTGYRKTPEYINYQKEYRRKWREKNPLKEKSYKEKRNQSRRKLTIQQHIWKFKSKRILRKVILISLFNHEMNYWISQNPMPPCRGDSTHTNVQIIKTRYSFKWLCVDCSERCKLAAKGLYESKSLFTNRINVLKKLLNLKETPLLWHCQKCKINHHHHRFFDIDHIQPKSKGGSNDLSNLQVLCPNCHKEKSLQDGNKSFGAHKDCNIKPNLRLGSINRSKVVK